MSQSQLCFNTNTFAKTLAAGMLVVLGMISSNGGKQLLHDGDFGKINLKTTKVIGTVLFTLGWIGIAYFTAWNNGQFIKQNNKGMMCLIACALILGSMIMMKYQMDKKGGDLNSLPKSAYVFLASYVVGWALLGYTVGRGKSKMAMILGIAAPVMMYISVIGAMPWQRENGVIDGPGMVIIGLGWVAFALANAM